MLERVRAAWLAVCSNLGDETRNRVPCWSLNSDRFIEYYFASCLGWWSDDADEYFLGWR